jgi:branched-chain amino acid transport system substrate-binding protein
MLQISRRALLGGVGTLPLIRSAAAQPAEVRIGFLAPISGPWARQGALKRAGADMAIEDINRAGGIKSLGGAPLRLVVADAGDSIERAKNAAQRLVAQETDMVAGMGAWLSSFTLAVTEVTERARLPWLSLSWADAVTERGYHYVLSTSAPSSRIAAETIPLIVALAEKATGRKPTKVGIIADSTAVAQAFVKPLREGGLAKAGLTAVVDETYTAPLADATPMVQRVRTTRPDFLVLYTSNVPDAKLVLEKLGEFGLGRGRIPIIAPGAQMGAPEMVANLGAENLEGIISIAANWGSAKQKPLLDDLCRRTKEPWMTQDTLSAYGQTALIADAVERAGSRNRDKVLAALKATDTAVGPARYFLGDRLAFDGKGRRLDAPIALFQWQKGIPVTVYPEADAFAPVSWPRRQA